MKASQRLKNMIGRNVEEIRTYEIDTSIHDIDCIADMRAVELVDTDLDTLVAEIGNTLKEGFKQERRILAVRNKKLDPKRAIHFVEKVGYSDALETRLAIKVKENYPTRKIYEFFELPISSENVALRYLTRRIGYSMNIFGVIRGESKFIQAIEVLTPVARRKYDALCGEGFYSD